MTDEQIANVVATTIKRELAEHMPCAAQGLSNEEVVMLRRVIKVLDGTAVAIGRTIVISFVTGVIGLIAYGFFHKIKGGP